jgi:hypothetical protein
MLQGDYKKMSKSAFVKNTMDAISASTSATIRSNSFQSSDVIPLQRITTNTSDISTQSSNYAQSLDSAMPRNCLVYLLTLNHGRLISRACSSKCVRAFVTVNSPTLLLILHSYITPPTNNRVSAALRHSFGTIIKKKVSCNDEYTATITSIQSASSAIHCTELPIFYTSNARYYKEGMVEGMVVCKHLLESKNQKDKNLDWKECFMAIEDSQLYVQA